MSSKAKKMAAGIEKVEPVETQSMEFRLSVNFYSESGETYEADSFMLVTGIPKDLPDSMLETVEKTVRVRFVQAMSSHGFIETYRRGQNRQECTPLYLNSDTVQSFNIKEVSKA